MAELAAETGLARPPAVVVGRQADAFTFGVPGRYAIALPRGLAVRWRHSQLFDPVLRHELAHVRHGDVPLALLARSVGFVLAPLLALPLVVGFVIGDSSLTPSYLWRAALLGAVVVLVSAQLLRTREYDADLRAAQLSGGPAAVGNVLAAVAPGPATRRFRTLLAKHPSREQRMAVLERPAGAAPVTFLDGFAAAFLAALVVPLLVSLVIAATVGALSTTVAEVTAAAIVGALLGGSVGLAQWRASVVGRLDAVRLSPWPAACGVGAGLAAGEMASLGNVAFVSPLGDTPPEWYLVVGVAGLSCTLLGHAAGEVWADAVPTLPGPRLVWVPALLVTGLLYTVLCWAGQALDLLLAGGGWSMVALWLVAMPQRWLPALALVVLVAAVGYGLVAGRRPGVAPGWLLEADAQVGWPRCAPSPGTVLSTAFGAGLAGAATIIGFRLLVGPGGSDQQTVVRFVSYVAIAAAVGWVAAFGLALLRPRTGLAVGIVVLPIAVGTTMAGFFALNAGLGGGLDRMLVTTALLGPVVAGFFLLLLAAPVLWFVRARDRVRRVWVVTTPIAIAAALLVLGIGGVVGSVVGGFAGPQPNPGVAVTGVPARARQPAATPRERPGGVPVGPQRPDARRPAASRSASCAGPSAGRLTGGRRPCLPSADAGDRAGARPGGGHAGGGSGVDRPAGHRTGDAGPRPARAGRGPLARARPGLRALGRGRRRATAGQVARRSGRGPQRPSSRGRRGSQVVPSAASFRRRAMPERLSSTTRLPSAAVMSAWS